MTHSNSDPLNSVDEHIIHEVTQMVDGVMLSASLQEIIVDLVMNDNKFEGMAGYVMGVRCFWTYSVKTAAAGGGFIFFNPTFFQSIPKETRKTVIAHEIWHLILKHGERGKGFDHADYNEAADHVINLGLKKDGFTFEGTEPYCNPIFNDLSTEQVYHRIHNPNKKKKDSPKDKPPPPPTPDEVDNLIQAALDSTGSYTDLIEQKEKNEDNLDEALKTRSDVAGKGCGAESASVKTLLAQTVNIQKILEEPYEVIFQHDLLDPISSGSRSYMRYSRRQGSNPMRMPGRSKKKVERNRLRHMVYALDVSGSISTKDAQLFKSSADHIKALLNPELMTVILWDTSIKFHKTFTDKEGLGDINVRAGGGTNLNPVYNLCKQLKPEKVVIFTDLQVSIPAEPEWETIWMVPSLSISSTYLDRVKYGTIYKVPE